jgi:hypothetical protein
MTYEKVTFGPRRSYALSWAVDGGKVRKLEGTYRLGKRGAISFLVVKRTRQLGTVLLSTRKGGIPQPHRLGLWLVLSGPKGKHPDGNLLLPKR